MKPEFNVSLSKATCIFIAVIMLAFSSQSYAATCTHYVSPTGSATWSNATNINTPTSVATAFANAAADNVVCFRGGTYNVPAETTGDASKGYYNVAHSGSAGHYITFMAYPDEIPLFNGTATGGLAWGTNGSVGEVIFGISCVSYITVDGFSLQSDNGTTMAAINIGYCSQDTVGTYPYHTQYVTVQNCRINGGTTVMNGTDNAQGIYIQEGQNITIQGNTIYNFRSVGDYHNTSAIKTYHDVNLVVQNNEIYNNSNGIYYKSDCEQCTISYNYIHNNYIGSMHAIFNAYGMPDTYIFHNVYAHHTYLAMSMDNDQSGGASADNWQIYNNTIYDSAINGVAFEGSDTAANGATIYNNITQAIAAGDELNGTGTSGLVAEDHNQWGTSSFRITINQYQGNQIQSSSLSAWQATTALASGGHPGASDLASNPLFTNGSGNYSLLSDFKLQANSPCKGAGRGGVDMGANIALVGVGANGKIPSPPSNLQ